MKAGAFDYVRPQSVAEAIELRSQSGRDSQFMAGGQSLVAMMNLRVAQPELVIDIGRLPELRAVSETADEVSLGSCVTHAAVEDGQVPDPSRGLMAKVAAGLAYRAIRTRGTLGGSLALSDPAAEWPTVLSALDAKVVLRGPKGERIVPCAEFTTGTYETKLAPDEILGSIRIPKLSAAARSGYLKFCRKSGEFASSMAVVVLDPQRGAARAVLGAANGAPLLLGRTSEALLAGRANAESLTGAIAADLDAAAAARRFDEFQRDLHAIIALRAALQVLA
ncbi:MAG TPA: FAD binding domain-containing protein [Alphaproteobacteria bacterium]